MNTEELMGYYTHGHVRCTLAPGMATRLTLLGIRDRSTLPPGASDPRLIALHHAFARVRLLTYWCRLEELCASFESRHAECETLMEAIRPLVRIPGLAADVWGYTSYESDMEPLVLYSTRRLTMARPGPDIVVRHEAPCGS